MAMYLLLVIFTVASRLMPHPANVAPIAALALFAGTTGRAMPTKAGRLTAIIAPLAALFMADIFIGFYTWQVMISVYVGFAVTWLLGILVRRYYSWPMIMGASVGGSIIFFLLTNAAVWAFTPMYAKTLAGLIQSYTLALPFLRNSLLGDLAYNAIFFGAYELAIKPIRLADITIKQNLNIRGGLNDQTN